MVVAKAADAFVLTIRAHDRPDVREVVAQIENSFALDDLRMSSGLGGESSGGDLGVK